MPKKLKCWRRSKTFFVGRTKIALGNSWERKKGVGWVYLYNKGMFRGKESEYVISTSSTGGSNPSDRENVGFESKSQAESFAHSYMKKHDRC